MQKIIKELKTMHWIAVIWKWNIWNPVAVDKMN